MATDFAVGDRLAIGTHTLTSRLIVGTGKYASYEAMAEALALSGTDCITVAVRRERLIDARGENILDYIDTRRYTLLPNTAGCFTAEDAVRVARLGARSCWGWKIRVPTGSNLKFWPTPKPCSPIRWPPWPPPKRSSPKAFRFCATPATTRSWPGGSNKPAR